MLTRIMFYKGHFIRDTSLISRKIKGQGLVSAEKLRDKLENSSKKFSDYILLWTISFSPLRLSANETLKSASEPDSFEKVQNVANFRYLL